MSHVPHELHEEFPEAVENQKRRHRLALKDQIAPYLTGK